jgi:Domain of unknown function (DUF222)/HNH endonuclease
MPLERVEAELCTLAGQIAAATSRFLVLLADFDAREGWAGWGVHSCAHWLSWRCGLGLHTAHEHVRVARALVGLPQIAAAFSQGRVSYSKVRAVTRVATADNETELLEAALSSPAAHVDRLVRGLRKARRTVDDDAARRRADGGQHSGTGDETDSGSGSSPGQPGPRPHVQWRWDDDGRLRIWGSLSAEDGARLLAGLTRMDLERRRTTHPTGDPTGGPTGGECGGEDRADDQGCGELVPAGTSYAQQAAGAATGADAAAGDSSGLSGAGGSSHPSSTGVAPSDLGPALVAGAELMCTTVTLPIHAPAADVVVHVDADTLVETARRTAADAATGSPREARFDDGPALLHGVLAMLACDGRIQLSVRAADGRILNLGRRRRRPNRAQLDALWRRDRGCAHPGCGRTRFLHAHHARAWAAGGRTDLDNLILLCGEHHRALHDGAFTVTALGRQRFRFHGPGGAVRPPAPPTAGDAATLVATHAGIEPTTIEPDWDGSPLDLPHATDVVLTRWAIHQAHRTGTAAAGTPAAGTAAPGSAN